MDEEEYDEYLGWVSGLNDIETWETNQVALDDEGAEEVQ